MVQVVKSIEKKGRKRMVTESTKMTLLIETWCSLLAWDFQLSLDFFDSGLYTCTAVARLTLALAKLSC